jgi:hypothetical protein
LGEIAVKAAAEDIPIQPQETHLFKIHPGQIPAWERKIGQRAFPDATKLQLKIEILSFGDGTGYFGNSSKIYHRAPVMIFISGSKLS